MSLLDDYQRPEETAKQLHVTLRTIARYESEPEGLPYVLIGGRKWHHIPTVRAWLAGKMRHPNKRRA